MESGPPTVASEPADSAGLLLTGRSPLWLLLAISVVFGAQNGLNAVTNQTAMYAQAPADSTGTAAGMLRTFMYLGAIASVSLISLSFGHAATDADLHRLAVILTAAAGLLAATLTDRKLAAARPRPMRRQRMPVPKEGAAVPRRPADQADLRSTTPAVAHNR